jgi:O-antigen/teichoic acid export membrane protein
MCSRRYAAGFRIWRPGNRSAVDDDPAQSATDDETYADDDRHESEMERLDRNTTELLNELRVAAVGIQVLFAFLLIVPFNTGWKKVNSFDRYDYFVTLLCIATSATLLVAPSIHHRLLFRRRQKAYLVRMGTRLTIVAMVFLTIGFTGILVLLSDIVFSGVTAAVVGVCTGVLVSTVWFGIPLARRRKLQQFRDRGRG